MKLGNTLRAIIVTIAAGAASWALLVSPLMLFGVHGVSSDHDKSLGKFACSEALLPLRESGGLRKSTLQLKNNRSSADYDEYCPV
jgi:hypothetical protein